MSIVHIKEVFLLLNDFVIVQSYMRFLPRCRQIESQRKIIFFLKIKFAKIKRRKKDKSTNSFIHTYM